ncbi:unnamed protein product [Schistosoma bovis]|nr:unnamed protein product [Schistosoma bovis]
MSRCRDHLARLDSPRSLDCGRPNKSAALFAYFKRRPINSDVPLLWDTLSMTINVMAFLMNRATSSSLRFCILTVLTSMKRPESSALLSTNLVNRVSVTAFTTSCSSDLCWIFLPETI